MSKGRTAVRIAGEGEGQNPFEGQEVPLGYLFLPDTRREPLRKMCRTFQTSAHAFSCRWPRSPSLFGLFLRLGGRSGPPSINKIMIHDSQYSFNNKDGVYFIYMYHTIPRKVRKPRSRIPVVAGVLRTRLPTLRLDAPWWIL